MATYYADLYEALRTVITTVWGIPDARIYRPQRLAGIPWEQKSADAPVVCLEVELLPSDRWGAANFADEGTIRITYIARSDSNGLTPTDLDLKMETLRTHLTQHELAAGQMIDYPRVSTGRNVEPNPYFLNRMLPYWAGMVELRVVIGARVGT